jgi:hypothetical protein
MALDHLITAHAAALYASDLPNQCRPSQAVVEAAIDSTLTACGGVDGCVGALAAAYGDHPETAAPRMKWALHIIDAMRSADRLGSLAANGFEQAVRGGEGLADYVVPFSVVAGAGQ